MYYMHDNHLKTYEIYMNMFLWVLQTYEITFHGKFTMFSWGHYFHANFMVFFSLQIHVIFIA